MTTRIAIAVVPRDDNALNLPRRSPPQCLDFLVGRRSATAALGGMWEFPGGKMEPGETPSQAAVRECQEESGLLVDVVRPLDQREHSYPLGVLELHFLLCRVSAESIDQPPLAPFQWIPWDQLHTHRHEFPAGNQPLLRQLAAFLGPFDDIVDGEQKSL